MNLDQATRAALGLGMCLVCEEQPLGNPDLNCYLDDEPSTDDFMSRIWLDTDTENTQ